MNPGIILADDDDGFRVLLGEVLVQAGYAVFPAANGIEALRLCEQHTIAAAIVDLLMPEKDGLETILEMRRRYPQIRIVAMSGGGLGSADIYLKMALKLGADAALAKPFANVRILDAIRRLLAPVAPSKPPPAP